MWDVLRPSGFGFLVVWALASCTSIGPVTIARDRFDYSQAITTSWQQQTLLNLVKIRYLEAPLFLDVTSVINQYSIAADARVGLGSNTSITGDNTATLGAGVEYVDRPTVTYVPLSGKRLKMLGSFSGRSDSRRDNERSNSPMACFQPHPTKSRFNPARSSRFLSNWGPGSKFPRPTLSMAVLSRPRRPFVLTGGNSVRCCV